MSQFDISNFDISKLNINDITNLNNFDMDKFNTLINQVNTIIQTENNDNTQNYSNNEIQETELQVAVEGIADEIKTEFDNEASQVKTQIDTYRGLFVNLENVYDLYDKYKKRNVELFVELKDETNDVLTNERKTYYEDQGIDNLKFYYYYFLFTIYIVCIIMFGVFSLKYPSQYSIIARICIFIFLIVLPFISSFILGNFIYLLHETYNLLPKNVYNNV